MSALAALKTCANKAHNHHNPKQHTCTRDPSVEEQPVARYNTVKHTHGGIHCSTPYTHVKHVPTTLSIEHGTRWTMAVVRMNPMVVVVVVVVWVVVVVVVMSVRVVVV